MDFAAQAQQADSTGWHIKAGFWRAGSGAWILTGYVAEADRRLAEFAKRMAEGSV
jgi:hypothetical protein